MATPDNPIDHTRDGNYQVRNPTITVTPAESAKQRPAPAPTWRQVGEPNVVSVENPPGT
jgi:hypothetical protein